MNKDIEKMLKYQAVDMKKYLLDKKLKNADDTKKLMNAMTRGKSLKDDYTNVSREMDSEMVSINKASEDFEKLLIEVNDLENSISDNANIEQIDYFMKKVDDLLKKIKDIENIGGDSKRSLEKYNEMAEKDYKQIIQCAKAVNELRPKFEQLKEDMKGDAKAIAQEMNDLIKNEKIDTESKIFKVYKDKCKHKMPVFVELNGMNCGGCGVDVPENVANTVNAEGYAECPNCGRILYQK